MNCRKNVSILFVAGLFVVLAGCAPAREEPREEPAAAGEAMEDAMEEADEVSYDSLGYVGGSDESDGGDEGGAEEPPGAEDQEQPSGVGTD